MRLYFTIDDFPVAKAFKLKKLDCSSVGKFGKATITATLYFNEQQFGYSYLPIQYVNDEQFKLTEEDCKDVNVEYMKNQFIYIAREEDLGPESTLSLLHANDPELLQMEMFNDKTPQLGSKRHNPASSSFSITDDSQSPSKSFRKVAFGFLM